MGALFTVISRWSRCFCIGFLVAVATAFAGTTYEPYQFTTVYGYPGVAGSMPGSGAMFRSPGGVAVDGSGNIYVADSGNASIRRIRPDGSVTTFAGSSGQHGSTDGFGSEARFDGPGWITINSAGVLYVSDSVQHTIRRVSPEGRVTLWAGRPGEPGDANGPGSMARFRNPAGVVCDSAGNLYVADSGNHSIRKIDSQGAVTTFTGGVTGLRDGSGTAARFNMPLGICISAQGTLYVSDPGNWNIRQITSAGEVTILAGPRDNASFQSGNVDGHPDSARFGSPEGLALGADGTLYVADHSNGSIRTVSSTGWTSTLTPAPRTYTGDYVDGPLSVALLGAPLGLARDADGNLYFSEGTLSTIRRITTKGVVSTLAGQPGIAGERDGEGNRGLFRLPLGLATDESGNLYIADTGNYTIRKITPEGVDTVIAGRVGQTTVLQSPMGVAVDRAGTVYIADTGNSVIRKLSPDGQLSLVAGGVGLATLRDGVAGEARFSAPQGVAVAGDGTVYVADTGNRAVRRITASGVVTTLGTSFLWPTGIVVNAAGIAFVADSDANSIYRLDPAGTVAIVAGGGLSMVDGSDDGPGTAARFHEPWAIALDAAENLYVADARNCLIRKITPAGMVSTIAGVPEQRGNDDGFGPAARFSSPNGIAVSRSGVIYVTEQVAHTIRQGVVPVAPSFSSSAANSTASVDSDATFAVVAKGTPAPTLQWQASADRGRTWQNLSDGDRYTGTRSATLTVRSASLGLSGTEFRCVATSAAGSTYSASATLTVVTVISRLANISARAYCSTGNSVTIGGFVVTGNARKRVLIRAVGPSLTTQGIGQNEVLLDPTVEVHHGGTIVARNDDWGTNENAADIPVVAAAIGANPLAVGDTRSSALLTTLDPGVYSFIVKGKNDTSGIVLLEVYDADATATDSKFVNIAARAHATTGNGVAIGGFVITGNAPKRVLMRAVGPTLTTQGIAQNEVLLDPTIELHHGSDPVIVNDDWGANANQTDIVTTGARIGATPFAATDTRSSALLMTLNPGVYTFLCKGKNDTAGIVLVEVYDAD